MVTYKGITIDRAARTITHRHREHRFMLNNDAEESLVFRMTCALVLGPGFSREQMFWMFYGNDPDGGPVTGPNVFSVCMVQRKWLWKKLDLELRRWRIAGVFFYTLVPTTQLGTQALYQDAIPLRIEPRTPHAKALPRA